MTLDTLALITLAVNGAQTVVMEYLRRRYPRPPYAYFPPPTIQLKDPRQ